jgi:hypothetical protein
MNQALEAVLPNFSAQLQVRRYPQMVPPVLSNERFFDRAF